MRELPRGRQKAVVEDHCRGLALFRNGPNGVGKDVVAVSGFVFGEEEFHEFRFPWSPILRKLLEVTDGFY